MSVEIKVPTLPESVADASIATWYKKVGEHCSRDENLVDIETDKVVLEVVAPDDGVLESILQEEGATVTANQLLALFNTGHTVTERPTSDDNELPRPATNEVRPVSELFSPAVRRLLSEHNLDATIISPTGKDGRLTKADVEKYIAQDSTAKARANQAPASAPTKAAAIQDTASREEKRVPMTRLRKRIAERLVQVQQSSAILTTFNEVNMKPVMDLRSKHKERFEKIHGVRLGFMSFFVKAVIEALKRFPDVNASIDGSDIIYHGYFDVGIAVSSPRGLVVPVLRDVDNLSFAGIEASIRELGGKAKENKLTLEELLGGTFTITNGGVFGSLMSTPIINPPQSAILGMHNINEKPVVENGEIVIRPMMYVALSYDHRIIDGRDSVGFLKTVKELVEDPARLLLEV